GLFTGDKLNKLVSHAHDQVQSPGQDKGPTALDGTVAIDEDEVLTGALTAIDLYGKPVEYALQGAAPTGLTFNSDGSFSFDPRTVFDHLAFGETATVSFQFAANTSQAGSNPATELITIIGLNDAPAFTSTTNFTVAENSTAAGLIGAVDPEHDEFLF